MAFIRILSPKSAPPVLRFDGSTEITPIFFSGKSTKNLRINSSTKEDFPEPPVPVIPSTGACFSVFSACAKCVTKSSCLFSASEINRAMVGA